MYLKRLVEFSEQISDQLPPIGYKAKRYQWTAVVSEENTIHFIRADRNDQRTIPDITRSSGIKPILLCDKAEYVFGLEKEGANERSKKRTEDLHQAYKSLLEKCWKKTKSKSIKLILDTLQAGHWELPEDMKDSEIIVFQTGLDHFPHEELKVQKFWSTEVMPVHSPKNKKNKMCIVCGESAPAVERHSIVFLIGRDRTKLISANDSAYLSYGLKASEVAPTCFECEQKYGQALNYLLKRYPNKELRGGPHTFTSGDVTYVYWMKEQSEEMNQWMSWISDPDPDAVRNVLMSPFTGKKTEASDFYLLALTANKGRLVVRDYIETPTWKVQGNLKSFFAAQEVGSPRLYGVYHLASTMYRDANQEMQKFAITEWVDWALKAKKLSGRIASHVLKRIQADGEMNILQAAAIKSWLVSQDKEEWTVHLDEGKKSIPYLCGRLFAVLEKVQEESIKSNETIAARFFGSASTTPKSVFGLLIRNSQAHLSKLQKERPGLAVNRSKSIQSIMSNIEEFPSVLDLHKQAEFALGYYHERQHFYKAKNKLKGEKEE